MDLLNIKSAQIISAYSIPGVRKRNTTAVSTSGARQYGTHLITTDNRE